MSSFLFQEIILSSNYDFENKSYLWIWHANKIPPHIGISSKGAYFSLKVSGKDIGLPCDRTLKKAISKKICLVLVELKSTIELNNLKNAFDLYENASPTSSTCLSPIKKCLNEPGIQQLSELLESLTLKGEISAVFGINIPENYSSLPDYSIEEIQNRLLLLSHAKRNTNIFKNC